MPETVRLRRLREAPEYLEQASRWFSREQWGIAQTEYMQSMRACLAGGRARPAVVFCHEQRAPHCGRGRCH